MAKKIIFIFLLFFLIISCNEHKYEIKSDGVYLTGWNEGNGNYERLVNYADPITFENINVDPDYSFALGKDKFMVFCDGDIVDGADPSTFRFVGNYIYRDSHNAYFLGFKEGGRGFKIDSIDVDGLISMG